MKTISTHPGVSYEKFYRTVMVMSMMEFLSQLELCTKYNTQHNMIIQMNCMEFIQRMDKKKGRNR